MRIRNRNIVLKAVTWNKDSHGLFDYETRSIDVRKFKTSSSVKLTRQSNRDIWFGLIESESRQPSLDGGPKCRDRRHKH